MRGSRRGRRQRHVNAEGRAGAGRALDLDAAAHALDDAPGDREAEAGAAELARGAAVGLLEFAEDAGLLLGRDADAGVAHLERDLAGPAPRLDDDATPPLSVNLMALPARLSSTWRSRAASPMTRARQAVVDVGGDLQALGLRARRQQLDHLLDQRGERERPRLEVERPASILEKSRISSISDSSASPEVFAALT